MTGAGNSSSATALSIRRSRLTTVSRSCSSRSLIPFMFVPSHVLQLRGRAACNYSAYLTDGWEGSVIHWNDDNVRGRGSGRSAVVLDSPGQNPREKVTEMVTIGAGMKGGVTAREPP